MVHRRTFVDDRYGVGEALDEHAFGVPLVARGKHLLFAGPAEDGETCGATTLSIITLSITTLTYCYI
jgi:hypothetical protein